MKKTKVTRSLLAACSVVALSAVMYGCVHDGDDPPPVDPATVDSDGDGVTDANDAFPNDATETADADGDGVGDNADAFPNDATETADSDGDGVGDNADAFPDDDTETADADGDGVGDNADLDDDNDGVADVHDQMPNDPTETVDSDGDGVGDNADLDDDNDGVLDADDWAPTDPMVQNPPAPTHEDVTMTVALGKAEQDALVALLKNPGDSDTLTVAAGGTATRAGVVFSCMSESPCTFTLTNSVGAITASVSTQKPVGADDPTVMAMIPLPPEALPRLNPAYWASIASILDSGIESTDPAPPASPHGNASTSVGGLGLDDFGAYNADELSITSDLDPNTATPHTPRVIDLSTGAVTTVGAGGSTIMASPKADMTDETIDHPKSVALAGWDQKTLFRDWGDTAGLGDGGYETGALVYNNMEDPTATPFDGSLATMFANAYVQRWFTLGVDADADGTNDTVTGINTAGQNWLTPLKMISINVEGSQAAAVQVNVPQVSADNRSQANEYRGTYFGAPGTFACIGTAACVIERAETGDVDFQIADTGAADGLQASGTWDFTPDPDATVMVPDQDWVVFGAWLTAPDRGTGEHRVGVLYDGMQPYGRDNSGGELDGTATYTGGATGVYVDGADSGLFTARAMLTANFDVAGTEDDNELSGRIDNFRDTAGKFLGADTAADPNDPVAGGENDWVLMLGSTAINASGTFENNGTVSGSADGVQWDAGEWTAQFFGPSTDAVAPTAVSGQFRAEIWGVGSASPTTDANSSPVTAVVGAFGAEKDEDD